MFDRPGKAEVFLVNLQAAAIVFYVRMVAAAPVIADCSVPGRKYGMAMPE